MIRFLQLSDQVPATKSGRVAATPLAAPSAASSTPNHLPDSNWGACCILDVECHPKRTKKKYGEKI